MTKKPKPPIIPRCLCGSFLHWVLQIASPSKYWMAMFFPTVKTDRYFRARHEYEMRLISWKIENRICTREEWHKYRRYRRQTGGRA